VATQIKVPRAIAALAASVVLLLAGCTSTVADPSSSLVESSSSSTASTSTVTSSTQVTTSTPATTSRSAPVTSSAGTSPSNPWPADLTPDQVTQAQAAIAAYVGYYKLVDQAYADPGKDWSADAAKWTTDPVMSSFLRNLAGTAALGQYRTGKISVEPVVTKVEPSLVSMTVCVDATDMAFLDSSGKSIKAPDAPGSYFRHVSDVQVARYEGGQWLVTFITDDYTKTC